MKTAGIIAEFNPFHLGHQYLIDHIRRERKADYIIAAMSGDFVQRGEPAVFSKHLRAKAALAVGADLVIELPVRFSTASAEGFAMGGVQLLDSLGVVDELCFGCETPDNDALWKAADLLLKEPALFRSVLKEELKKGRTFPKARQEALNACPGGSALPGGLLSGPNNILAVEYVKALKKTGSPMVPVPILRQGNGYLDPDLSGPSFPSALALRRALKTLEPDAAASVWEAHVPPGSFAVFRQALADKSWIVPEDLSLLLRYRLLSETAASLEQYADISRDLANRIYALRLCAQGFEETAQLMKSRQLTRSHVMRGLLHILLNLKKEEPPLRYVRVLGLRRRSSGLLKSIKNQGKLPLVIKPASSREYLSDSDSIFASDLYQTLLSAKTGQPFKTDPRFSPVVVP